MALPNITSWQRRALSPIQHVWFGPDNNGQIDDRKPTLPTNRCLVSPVLQVGAGPFTIYVRASIRVRVHRQRESAVPQGAWDGGVVEISTDGGASWNAIGSTPSFYNGQTNARYERSNWRQSAGVRQPQHRVAKLHQRVAQPGHGVRKSTGEDSFPHRRGRINRGPRLGHRQHRDWRSHEHAVRIVGGADQRLHDETSVVRCSHDEPPPASRAGALFHEPPAEGFAARQAVRFRPLTIPPVVPAISSCRLSTEGSCARFLSNLDRTLMINDLRIALRNLARMPWFAVAFILTLGLGIGANTAIFSMINGVLLRPLPYPEADRIMHLRQAADRRRHRRHELLVRRSRRLPDAVEDHRSVRRVRRLDLQRARPRRAASRDRRAGDARTSSRCSARSRSSDACCVAADQDKGAPAGGGAHPRVLAARVRLGSRRHRPDARPDGQEGADRRRARTRRRTMRPSGSRISTSTTRPTITT